MVDLLAAAAAVLPAAAVADTSVTRVDLLAAVVVDLTAAILADLSMLMRRLIGERINLEIQHERGLGLVKVDQGQLEQVLINLVVNARDAMPEGGTLHISTANG